MAKASIFLLKSLMILILCFWLSLWILNPTEIWTTKWKQFEDKATKTIFSYNSVNFAVYTFPLLALAMVGFVYLELNSKGDGTRQQKNLISGLSNPLIINRTVGILSAVEILCISLFVIFLCWTFYVRISDDFKKIMPYKQFKLNPWEYKVIKVAIRCGLLSEACIALLLLPILKGMAVFKIFGIQFEASVKYHVWLGTSLIIFSLLHASGIFFIWAIKHHIQHEMWKWQKTGRIYLAGEIAFIAGLAILITSLPQIRRKNFGVFYYTHHLYLVFFIFFMFHVGDRHFYMVFPAIFLFGLDKLLRILYSMPKTCILSARIFPCKAAELTLPKHPKLNYSPTSTIFVKIPSISNYQWHPFSIISSSKANKHTISIIIKSQGWWTTSLNNLILANKLNEEEDEEEANHKSKCIIVAIEGPYGPSSIDFLRYDTLILVAGGIGITPFLSILQEIDSMKNDYLHQLPSRIELIYAVKKSTQISLLNPVFSQLVNSKRLCLKMKIFVTGENQSGYNDKTMGDILSEAFSQIHTVQFDTPMQNNYAISGVENSIKLAAIIGIASILFIVFLVCFNHTIFHHPAKKPSIRKIPSFITDSFLLCSFTLAIICSCLVAFFVRLKRMKNDHPSFTYVSDLYKKHNWTEIDADFEEHCIHFGTRPNFQEILSNLEKEEVKMRSTSSNGVFVCGPETMKESVASACKVMNTKAFSFHSLNFSI